MEPAKAHPAPTGIDFSTFKSDRLTRTTPAILKTTAMNFVSVNLSLEPDGRQAASIKVNRLLLDESTFTRPASVWDNAAW